MTKLEQLKNAIDLFKAAQTQWRDVGAEDSEPRNILRELLNAAATGGAGPDDVPLGAVEWDLFDSHDGAEEGAAALSAEALKCVEIIRSCGLDELVGVKSLLAGM